MASIGSTTITGRPASDSGSLLTYGLGANVASSRLIPTNPTSASGSSSWAAWTNPSPARRIGTTTGCTASRRAGAVVSGVSTDASTVGSDSVALRHQQRADALEVLAEQGVRCRAVTDPGQGVDDERVVDDRDDDGSRPLVGSVTAAPNAISAASSA